MSAVLFIDAETSPADAAPGAGPPARAFEATVTEPPAAPTLQPIARNLVDPAKIAAATEAKARDFAQALIDFDEAVGCHEIDHYERAMKWWAEESLDPIGRHPHLGGRIACIGFAVDDQPVGVLTGDERNMLARLDALLVANPRADVVGHNLRGFDAPFLAARCLVLGVAPTVYACFRRRDKWGPGRHCVDTAELIPQITYQGRTTGTGKLVDWCRALGLTDGAQPGNGADVLGWILDDRLDLVVAHCRADVGELRQLYRMLVNGPVSEVSRVAV